LTFAIYALAKYPHVQDKARKEVDEILGDQEPTPENLKKLDYLNMVIQETLRKYSPVGNTTARVTQKACQLGDYKVPKGVRISTI
jgi:cytochrome P450